VCVCVCVSSPERCQLGACVLEVCVRALHRAGGGPLHKGTSANGAPVTLQGHKHAPVPTPAAISCIAVGPVGPGNVPNQ
jgi:hypothetical protein